MILGVVWVLGGMGGGLEKLRVSDFSVQGVGLVLLGFGDFF